MMSYDHQERQTQSELPHQPPLPTDFSGNTQDKMPDTVGRAGELRTPLRNNEDLNQNRAGTKPRPRATTD